MYASVPSINRSSSLGSVRERRRGVFVVRVSACRTPVERNYGMTGYGRVTDIELCQRIVLSEPPCRCTVSSSELSTEEAPLSTLGKVVTAI